MLVDERAAPLPQSFSSQHYRASRDRDISQIVNEATEQLVNKLSDRLDERQKVIAMDESRISQRQAELKLQQDEMKARGKKWPRRLRRRHKEGIGLGAVCHAEIAAHPQKKASARF